MNLSRLPTEGLLISFIRPANSDNGHRLYLEGKCQLSMSSFLQMTLENVI